MSHTMMSAAGNTVRKRVAVESTRVTRASTTIAAAASAPMMSCQPLLVLAAWPRAFNIMATPPVANSSMPMARSAWTVVSCSTETVRVMTTKAA